jgi:hypothetical protein
MGSKQCMALGFALLLVGVAMVPPAAAAAPLTKTHCECVAYILEHYPELRADARFPDRRARDAKDYGEALRKHGFHQVSAPVENSAQLDVIVIIKPQAPDNHIGPAGHIGELYHVIPRDLLGHYEFYVDGAKQPDPTAVPLGDPVCNNVTRASFYYNSGSPFFEFWVRAHH